MSSIWKGAARLTDQALDLLMGLSTGKIADAAAKKYPGAAAQMQLKGLGGVNFRGEPVSAEQMKPEPGLESSWVQPADVVTGGVGLVGGLVRRADQAALEASVDAARPTMTSLYERLIKGGSVAADELAGSKTTEYAGAAQDAAWKAENRAKESLVNTIRNKAQKAAEPNVSDYLPKATVDSEAPTNVRKM